MYTNQQTYNNTHANMYKLPIKHMVGGETLEFRLNIKNQQGLTVDLSRIKGTNLAISNFSDPENKAILSYTFEKQLDADEIYSILYFSVPTADTRYLEGKFKYQVTIVDKDSSYDIGCGLITIKKNTNPTFVL